MFRIFDFLSCEQKHQKHTSAIPSYRIYSNGTTIGVPTSALIVTGASATKVDNT